MKTPPYTTKDTREILAQRPRSTRRMSRASRPSGSIVMDVTAMARTIGTWHDGMEVRLPTPIAGASTRRFEAKLRQVITYECFRSSILQ
jgi:hypothetical protein